MSQEWTPPPSSPAPAAVPNYLVPAIITLFCCLPLGIVAVVFAARVNGQVQAGDTQGALDSSRKAKMFAYIGLGLGLHCGDDCAWRHRRYDQSQRLLAETSPEIGLRKPVMSAAFFS
jgi:hypothetical protein